MKERKILENIDLLAEKIKCDYEKISEDSEITEVAERYFELLEEGKNKVLFLCLLK